VQRTADPALEMLDDAAEDSAGPHAFLPERTRRQRLSAGLHELLETERPRLVLWLPVCLAFGIVLYFSLPAEPSLWLTGSLVPLALGLLLAARRGWLGVSRRPAEGAAALLAVCLGLFLPGVKAATAPPMPDLPRRAALVEGTVLSSDLMATGRRRVVLDAVRLGLSDGRGDEKAGDAKAGEVEAGDEPPPLARMLRVTLAADDPARLVPGDRVRLRAMLRAPAPPSLPGGRDPQREAFFSALGGSGYALDPAIVLRHGRSASAWLRHLREHVALRIETVLPGPRGAIAATLLTGLGTAIPQADRDAFAASGLAHLLAVAGLHLGIVMGLVLTITRMSLAAWEWGALRLPGRQIAALAALLAGFGYMEMTGMHLPGVRSLSMATVAVLALVIGRRAVTLRAWALAAGLILLASPQSLLDVAFQMSFSAVLALLAGYEAVRPLMRWLQERREAGRLGALRYRVTLHVAQLGFTSLLAGTASLPYAAFHFGRVQFYFVLANLLAVPLTAFWVLPQGLLSLALMPWGLDPVTLRPMGAGIGVILLLARGVASFPAASIAVPAPPDWGLALVSLGLCWLCLWRRRWRLLGLLLILPALASPWLRTPPDLLVSGDARVIAARSGGVMLVQQAGWTDPLTVPDWRRAWGIAAEPVTLPADGAPAGAPDIVCNPAACLLPIRGLEVLLVRPGQQGAIEPDDCSGVALLVSPDATPGLCPGVRRIDRLTILREGAAAAWRVPGGFALRTVRQERGRRPWTASDRPASGSRPTLPMAQAE